MKKLIYAVLIAIFAMLVVESCQQDHHMPDQRFASEYLAIDHEIDIEKLTNSEKTTLFKAFGRVATVLDEDGSISFIHMSGKELNMSESIYEYFKKSVENVLFEKVVTRCSENLDDSCGVYEGEKRDNDCLLYTIEAILLDMKITSYTIDKIRNELTIAGYYSPKEGVRISNLNDALRLFFQIDVIEKPKNLILKWPNDEHFIVIRNTADEGVFHAGTLKAIQNGGVWYRDDQGIALGDTLDAGLFSVDDVISIIELSKK